MFARKNKYRAKPTNGFPSKLESAVYDYLKRRELLNEIMDIKRQQQVVLQDGARDVRITWRLDFSFVDCKTSEVIYAEAKGIETNDYKLKLKIWRKLRPATLEIYKGTYARIVLAERIEKNEDDKKEVS